MPFLALDTNGKTAATEDGVTWNSAVQAIPALTYPRVCDEASGLWMITNETFGAVHTSPDGITWTARTGLGTSNYVRDIAHGLGTWVAVTDGAYVFSSTDGITWTQRAQITLPDPYPLTRVGYGNGVWIALNAFARIYTSSDLTTWTHRGSGGSEAVLYAGGQWLVASNSGAIRTSPDGVTWTLRTSGFGSTAIQGLAYGAGLYVAVGLSGKLATSPDGITWTLRTSSFGTTAIYNVKWDGERFVAVGASGKAAYSLDGITWTAKTTGLGTTLGLGAQVLSANSGIWASTEADEVTAFSGARIGAWASAEAADSGLLQATHIEPRTGVLAAQEWTDLAALTGVSVTHGMLAGGEGADGATLKAFHDWAGGLNPALLQTLYTLTLTDPAGSLPELTLPMSSFQATAQTEGLSSFLSCVVPAALPYAEAITERLNGELVVSKGYRFADGSVQTEEILRIPLGEIRLDEGPNRVSATLSGYGVVAPGTPKTRALTGIRYRNWANGLRRVRADVDLFLRPGDTALDGTEAFTVSYISYYVGPEGQFMEAAERAL